MKSIVVVGAGHASKQWSIGGDSMELGLGLGREPWVVLVAELLTRSKTARSSLGSMMLWAEGAERVSIFG